MSDPGYIYIMAAGGICTGLYKIGLSINPTKRLKKTTNGPFPISIIHTVPCKNMSEVESGLHMLFHEDRVNGEWFKLNDSQLSRLLGCTTEDELRAMSPSSVPTPIEWDNRNGIQIDWRQVRYRMALLGIRTDKALALGSGVHPNTIGKRGGFRSETVDRLARYLQCSPFEIIELVGQEKDNA